MRNAFGSALCFLKMLRFGLSRKGRAFCAFSKIGCAKRRYCLILGKKVKNTLTFPYEYNIMSHISKRRSVMPYTNSFLAAASFEAMNDYLQELHLLTITLRLLLATLCAGVIGLERQRKSRPAGLRTHIVVCLGAALVMMINQYLLETGYTTDAARLGAQVISGIGFLGAGTIILTGRSGKPQVKGLTTAASLWTSACMGLAIGCGFYSGAILTCLFALFAVSVLNRIDKYFYLKVRTLVLQIELSEPGALDAACKALETTTSEVRDIHVQKHHENGKVVTVATIDLRLPNAAAKNETLVAVAAVSGVLSIEEL